MTEKPYSNLEVDIDLEDLKKGIEVFFKSKFSEASQSVFMDVIPTISNEDDLYKLIGEVVINEMILEAISMHIKNTKQEGATDEE